MATSDDRVRMLVLAGLTYRGFHFRSVVEGLHETWVGISIDRGLDAAKDVIGRWRRVWGPGTRCSNDYDESAMYVAESDDDPPRLVIAVRGTNPISLTDWLRGDFDVARPVDWPGVPGKPAAKVSGSTALGLNTLLELTEPPHARWSKLVGTFVVGAGRFATRAIDGFELRFPIDHERPLDLLGTRIQAILDRWRPPVGAAPALTVDAVVKGLARLGAASSKVITWPTPVPDGTLLDFLVTKVKRSESRTPIDVIVTGHSKGGALAPALALWLSQHRERWAPPAGVRIGCYTYAGPTPGDGAFARRVGTELDGPTLRMVNTDDIVTHVWDDVGLGSIATLLDPQLAWAVPIVAGISGGITNGDDYQPVGLRLESFSGLALPGTPKIRELAVQLPHQHLEAYLEHVGLHASGVNVPKLFFG